MLSNKLTGVRKNCIILNVLVTDRFLEIEGERDHCQGKEIISLLVHFPDLVGKKIFVALYSIKL